MRLKRYHGELGYMKEKGPVRKTLETAGKVWTIVSIPIELYLLGHGIATGNTIETLLGGGGLVGDVFTWKWLSRDRRNEFKDVPALRIVREKGS